MNESVSLDISGPLRALIAESGRSLRGLAEATGIAHPNLSGICRGATDPRASTVARILKELGKSWSDLDPAGAARKKSRKNLR
jgi:transcriptional regulator with XRE-family HTH domain